MKKKNKKSGTNENQKKEEIDKKEQIKDEPVSISEINKNYEIKKNSSPLIIIMIALLILLTIGYFGHNYLNFNLDFSFLSEKKAEVKEEIPILNITNSTVEQKIALSCEEEFIQNILPNNLTLIRQSGNYGDWIFNPLDNTFNNYLDKTPLLPQRNIFYTQIKQNEFIAREGMTSKEFFVYSTPLMIVEYNPILIDSDLPEEIIQIKGIPMIKKQFEIKDAQITKCIKAK